jgi:hippurate hydrolase
MAAEAVSAVLGGLASVRVWQEDVYRDLHAHPELPHHEHRTAGRVAERLRSAGCEVHEGVGGTGVVGVLHNGEGPTVLLRADMDALPVREATGLPYASTQTAADPGADGEGEVPVMHACGHDAHVTCLLGATALMAQSTDAWSGTLVAVFQPAEETADGARGMLEGGLPALLNANDTADTDAATDGVDGVDVAMAQHVLPMPAGVVGTRAGPTLSAADSMRITVHGRGAHGSMPQAAVDPVVLAAMIVVRLQAVVSREVAPGDTAVLTVGSVQAGTKSNVIPDHAVLQLNVRTYDEATRTLVLAAIQRIVRAECQASGSPREPEFELFDRYPLTDNDADVTGRVAAAFAGFFGSGATELPQQSASEDFSDLPTGLGAPYTYWGIGGTDPDTYRAAEEAGRVAQDIPVNHSAAFAPVIQPTLDTGTQALVVAAMAWLAPPDEARS